MSYNKWEDKDSALVGGMALLVIIIVVLLRVTFNLREKLKSGITSYVQSYYQLHLDIHFRNINIFNCLSSYYNFIDIT